jgi:NAD(P)H-dependent flavin oxidoreductase YrpB (nitropropane dioxygenase family)
VAAAVSKAGGLGVLGIGGASPETIDRELDLLEAALGDKPYGVDALIPWKSAAVDSDDAERMIPAAHKAFVDELLAKYGVGPLQDEIDPEIASVLRQRGDIAGYAAHLLELALARPQMRLAASALGPPPPYLVEQAHRNEVLVAALVGRAAHAERQKQAGVDIVVAQGYEAGGHVGEIGTMVLVPEVVDAVAPLPVLAAGGIASGRQMAAALALGAQGVWTGSVWLTTEEAETHPVVKKKFLAASSSDTVRSRARTGKPARQLRSAWTDEWEQPTAPEPLPMPLQRILVAEAQERIRRAAHTPGSGGEQLVNYFVGQVVGSLRDIRPARRVLLDMVTEYIAVAESLAREIGGTP